MLKVLILPFTMFKLIATVQQPCKNHEYESKYILKSCNFNNFQLIRIKLGWGVAGSGFKDYIFGFYLAFFGIQSLSTKRKLDP